MRLQLRYHSAIPNWVKLIGLKVKAVPECEGGGFMIDREQGEEIFHNQNTCCLHPYIKLQQHQGGKIKCGECGAEMIHTREGYEPASEALTIADYEQAFQSHRDLVRQIDVEINGEEGAAKQASLCDLVGQIEQLVAIRDAAKEVLKDVIWTNDAFAIKTSPPGTKEVLDHANRLMMAVPGILEKALGNMQDNRPVEEVVGEASHP